MSSRFDLVVRNGTVIDGTGSDPRTADVAVRDGRIAAVGHFDGDERPTRLGDGINTGEHHTRRHVSDGARQCEAATAHVVRGDLVSEVDHDCMGREVAYDGLHHTDGFVACAEIGEERNRVVAPILAAMT